MIAFIKGADEQIYKFATKADKNSDLMDKLQKFSSLGLRSLMYSKKIIESAEF